MGDESSAAPDPGTLPTTLSLVIPAFNEEARLPFAGAGQLRVPPADVETYARLVDLLHRHRCTDFIGYPNVNSLSSSWSRSTAARGGETLASQG